MIADDKHYLVNRDNLRPLTQMQLSQKQKTFSDFFFVFLKWKKLRWKNSLLVIYKIPRLFVNTLTADGKHYRLNRDNLTEPIQMQLSQKLKIFLNFFLHFQNLY